MDIRKSGTNLKLALTGETYDDIYTRSMSVTSDDQISLIDGLNVITIPCWQILIQADPSNTANILVGNQIHGCHIVLRAGESLTIPINRAEKVFVRVVNGGDDQTVNWIAVL